MRNRGNPGRGRVMTDDAIRGDWKPAMKSHHVNVKLPPELYSRIRREADASGMSLSAVMRLALEPGVERVEADRILRELTSTEGGS